MGLNECAAPVQRSCMQAALLSVPRRHTMLVCGIYFIKSLHRDKNAQVDRAEQLSTLWQNNAVALILQNCTFNKRTSRHLSGKQCGWQPACCYSVRERKKQSNDTSAGWLNIVYGGWWLAHRVHSGVWGMAVVTGTVGLAFFKERLPNANKEDKNSYTTINKKNSAEANTRQVSRRH